MPTLLKTSLALLLAVLTACAGNTSGSGGTEGGASLVVENRSSIDMDIYARSQTGRATRVGFAPNSETTTFKLVPAVLVGAGSVTFEGRPVGRRGEAIVSEPYNLSPGDEVSWSIPPQ
jgi:hypothetical protein